MFPCHSQNADCRLVITTNPTNLGEITIHNTYISHGGLGDLSKITSLISISYTICQFVTLNNVSVLLSLSALLRKTLMEVQSM